MLNSPGRITLIGDVLTKMRKQICDKLRIRNGRLYLGLEFFLVFPDGEGGTEYVTSNLHEACAGSSRQKFRKYCVTEIKHGIEIDIMHSRSLLRIEASACDVFGKDRILTRNRTLLATFHYELTDEAPFLLEYGKKLVPQTS